MNNVANIFSNQGQPRGLGAVTPPPPGQFQSNRGQSAQAGFDRGYHKPSFPQNSLQPLIALLQQLLSQLGNNKGCCEIVHPAPMPTPNPIPPTAGQLETLNENREKWDQSNTGTISYTYQAFGFTDQRPVNIVEQDDQIISATFAETGEAVPDFIADQLKPISGRLDELESDIRNNIGDISVDYNEQFGYPEEFNVRFFDPLVDGRSSYTITNFERQP